MKWKLNNIVKETDHPFLNYYTIKYEVEKEDKSKKEHTYFIASRNQSIEELRINKQDFHRSDAVLVGAYLLKGDDLFLLLEKQFRPALNHEIVAFPAGLTDKEDKDIITTALRELKEETGYDGKDVELIMPPSPTSEGLSDECNSAVIASITSKGEEHKEEFEDINTKLYSVKEVEDMLADKSVIFSNSSRLLALYLIERFAKKKGN